MKIYSQRNGETGRQEKRRDEKREGRIGNGLGRVFWSKMGQENEVKEKIEQMRRG